MAVALRSTRQSHSLIQRPLDPSSLFYRLDELHKLHKLHKLNKLHKLKDESTNKLKAKLNNLIPSDLTMNVSFLIISLSDTTNVFKASLFIKKLSQTTHQSGGQLLQLRYNLDLLRLEYEQPNQNSWLTYRENRPYFEMARPSLDNVKFHDYLGIQKDLGRFHGDR